MQKLLIIVATCTLLAGCGGGNQQVRGMSTGQWQALKGEQKQFVVDSAYQKDVAQTLPAHTLLEQGKIACQNA